MNPCFGSGLSRVQTSHSQVKSRLDRKIRLDPQFIQNQQQWTKSDAYWFSHVCSFVVVIMLFLFCCQTQY